jgi:hypothetical protein
LNRLHPTQIDRDDETQAPKNRNTSPILLQTALHRARSECILAQG